MWIKALLAAAPAALFLAAPAQVAHADGACTALANVNTADAWKACVAKTNARCGRTGGFFTESHVTCIYSDGGRDDCVLHYDYALVGAGPLADMACTYFPPGAESAPPAGAAPEPAPTAEPVPSQP